MGSNTRIFTLSMFVYNEELEFSTRKGTGARDNDTFHFNPIRVEQLVATVDANS